MSELRYTANTQLEQLHARYVGTGHADITKHEWLTHQHRDTHASIAGRNLNFVNVCFSLAVHRRQRMMIENEIVL
ncbi:hypothetical protein O181_038607 [Austropuccinia psidii MF-1]|uniref:Splicing factor subunit n=1 Tax=Austropuccinia psidii MF-1 TaxID=1389203 RepID=A0A9Q3DB92_9BASI|nr:hypothetical protein [Austropuccinia psidii MF-1]